MKASLLLGSLTIILSLWACQPPAASQDQASESLFPAGEWVDLTYPFDRNTIYWPTSKPFGFDTVFAGTTDKGYYYSAFNIQGAEHGGTHIDAPIHFSEGKKSVDEVPLEQLIGQAVVIDVSERAADAPDYQVSVADFEAWEARHGALPEGAIVLLRTGFGQYWPNAERYMGTAQRGEAAVAKLHFPGLAPAAATWLVNQRNIKAIGLDTPSIDYGQSSLFESHRILFKAEIPAFENVANLDKLPPTGAFVLALPMRIKGGSGAPLRIIAMLPEA
jgi:kynurenine formamidase